MYNTLEASLSEAKSIVIIQPENPDGDSLGTALALNELLQEQSKTVSLFCTVDMPKYLRYIQGWDYVEKDWTGKYDLAIIVDTASDALLEKSLQTPGVRHFLDSHPVLVLDHHGDGNADDEPSALSFSHELVESHAAAATGELVADIGKELGWTITPLCAELLFTSIMSDTLGLTTPSVTPHTFATAAEMVAYGAVPADLETRRREFMKKPADILNYKGELIKRIDYHCDGQLATVHIPWEDIQKYSDRYNPSVLVLDEMRLVEGVEIAVALKTYPDGKITGKIRANKPIALDIAGYFGGGGHPYAAGFKMYETYDNAIAELVVAMTKIMEALDETI